MTNENVVTILKTWAACSLYDIFNFILHFGKMDKNHYFLGFFKSVDILTLTLLDSKHRPIRGELLLFF